MGCDAQFLKLWFEFQFDEKMNWTNYGSFFNLQPLEKHENITKSNKYNDEIELNHTTKILRFLDHLNKTDPDLCKFATESYSNLS